MTSMLQDRHGRFCVYDRPQERMIYVLGADVAEGLETGDHSAICVLDNNFKEVASWHGHIAPDLFGKIIYHVGKHFNNALAAIEVNNHGLTTVNKVRDMEYPNIYARTVKEERHDKYTQKLGWHTNVKTKALLLDDFIAAYRDKSLTVRDVNLLKEMLSLTIEADGSVVLNGKDRVVAMCLAIQAMKQVCSEGVGVYEPDKQKKTYKTLEEKLAYYDHKRVHESSFE